MTRALRDISRPDRRIAAKVETQKRGPGRARKVTLELPYGVHTVRAKGKLYFYYHPGRGTSKAGKPVSLGSDPTQIWARWQAVANGEVKVQAPPPRRGFIYFVAEKGGAIKIGFARNVESRLKSLQTGHPHPLRLLLTIDGSIALEKGLHRRFAHLKLSGEWFLHQGRLAQFIAKRAPE